MRRGQRVVVVGRADGHGVDALAHLVEHLAVVVVLLGVRDTSARPAFERVLVDVADGDDVAEAGGVARVAVALAAHADAGEVDPLVRRLALCESVFCGRGAEARGADAGDSGGADELAPTGSKLISIPL